MMRHKHQSPIEIVSDDHVSGTRDAVVTLLEYGDYECPHCGAAHEVVKALQQSLGKDLLFVFRNFPLRMAHPHAENAAEAAEAAEEAGNFWPMHDMLFENQEYLEDDDLLEYGERVGLLPEALKADLDAHRFCPRVQRDVVSGMRAGVNGTPTFFINGIRHNGGYEFTNLLNAIVEAGHLSPH